MNTLAVQRQGTPLSISVSSFPNEADLITVSYLWMSGPRMWQITTIRRVIYKQGWPQGDIIMTSPHQGRFESFSSLCHTVGHPVLERGDDRRHRFKPVTLQRRCVRRANLARHNMLFFHGHHRCWDKTRTSWVTRTCHQELCRSANITSMTSPTWMLSGGPFWG